MVCSKIIRLVILLYLLSAQSFACIEFGRNYFVLNFGKTYQVTNFEVFDWVYARCSYLLKDKLPDIAKINPNIEVTLLADTSSPVTVEYLGLLGDVVHVAEFSYSGLNSIILRTSEPYHSISFSRILSVRGLVIRFKHIQ